MAKAQLLMTAPDIIDEVAAALAAAAAVFAAGQVYSILARPADAVGAALAGGEVRR